MIEFDTTVFPVYKGIWQLKIQILRKTITSAFFLNAPEIEDISSGENVNFEGLMEDELGRARCKGLHFGHDIKFSASYMTYLSMPLDSILSKKIINYEGQLCKSFCNGGILKVGRLEGEFTLEPFAASSCVDKHFYQKLVRENDLRRKVDWLPV